MEYGLIAKLKTEIERNHTRLLKKIEDTKSYVDDTIKEAIGEGRIRNDGELMYADLISLFNYDGSEVRAVSSFDGLDGHRHRTQLKDMLSDETINLRYGIQNAEVYLYSQGILMNSLIILRNRAGDMTFRLVKEIIKDDIGDKPDSVYWCAGHDLLTVKNIGGDNWDFVALDYENGSYDSDKKHKPVVTGYDDKNYLTNKGFHPISWDVTQGVLPQEISAGSKDLSLIWSVGESYGRIKEGLWYCATEAVRPGGVIVSDKEMLSDYQDGFVQITDIAGIDGFDAIPAVKFRTVFDPNPRMVRIWKKKEHIYTRDA